MMTVESEFLDGIRWTDLGYDIQQICIITEDVIGVHNGSFIQFVFCKSGKSRIYSSDKENLKGIGIVTARDDVSAIAWSEADMKPNIHIYQYSDPNITKEIVGNTKFAYTALCFNHEEYLAGLSGFPDFKISLWRWQKGQLLYTIKTELTSPKHMSFSPNLGMGPAKFLLVHDQESGIEFFKLRPCGKEIKIKSIVIPTLSENQEAKLPISTTWRFPGDVFVLGKERNIYKINIENEVIVKIIIEDSVRTLFNKLTNEFDGFIKCHYDSFIFFLPRLTIITKMNVAPLRLELVKTFDHDFVLMNCEKYISTTNYIGWTSKAGIVRFETTETTAKPRWIWNENDAKTLSVGFVNHFSLTDEYFFVFDTNCRLNIYNFASRKSEFSETFQFPAVKVICHPLFPVFLIGTSDGRIIFESCTDVETKFYRELNIYDTPMDLIIFDAKGNFAVVGTVAGSKIFLLDLRNLQCPIIVAVEDVEGRIQHVDLTDLTKREARVVTFSAVDDDDCEEDYKGQRFLCQIVSVFGRNKNDLILIGTLKLSELCSGIALSEDSKYFYTFSSDTECLNQYCVPNERNLRDIRPSNTLCTGHKFYLNDIRRSKHHLVLSGVDGKITFVTPDFSNARLKPLRSINLFHLFSGGVYRLDINGVGDIISANLEGAFQIFDRKEKDLVTRSLKIKKFETEKLEPIIILKEKTEQSWLEQKIQDHERKEREKYEDEINSVKTGLDTLREKIAELLEINKTLPEEDQIDEIEFELDREEINRIIQEGEEKVESKRQEILAKIESKKREAMDLRKIFWDNMFVKGRALKGIESNIIVRNYPLLPLHEDETRKLEKVKKQRVLENALDEITESFQHRWINKEDPPPSSIGNVSPNRMSMGESTNVNDEINEPVHFKDGASEEQQEKVKDKDTEISIDEISKSFSDLIGLEDNHRDNSSKDQNPKDTAPTETSNMVSTEEKKKLDAQYRFFGSRSYELMDLADFPFIHQCKITSRRQAYQQIILLKVK